MTDDQIRMLLRLGTDEAKMLLDQGEYSRGIQGQMFDLVRKYQVRLPLNCFQSIYFGNRYSRRSA